MHKTNIYIYSRVIDSVYKEVDNFISSEVIVRVKYFKVKHLSIRTIIIRPVIQNILTDMHKNKML